MPKSSGVQHGAVAAPHLCYAGLGITMFTFVFPCLMVVMFLMRAPLRYLTATQTLYIIVLALYVLHILSDLAIISCSVSDRIRLRTAMAVTCPLLCAVLSLPTMGMLGYTKSKDGFSSDSHMAALGCSILVVPLELLHAALAAWLYWAYSHNKDCCCCKIYGLFPCFCICMVTGKSPSEDRQQLPSAAASPARDHGELRVIPSSASWRLDQMDSVEFHPSPSGLMFSRAVGSNSNSSDNQTSGGHSPPRMISFPNVDNTGMVPNPIPPPPAVKRLTFKDGQSGPAAPEDERESLDMSFDNDLYMFQPKQTSEEEPIGQEYLRPEPEMDLPISEMAITPDMGLETTHK